MQVLTKACHVQSHTSRRGCHWYFSSACHHTEWLFGRRVPSPTHSCLHLTFQDTEDCIIAVAFSGGVGCHAVVSPSITLPHIHDLENTIWKSYKPEWPKGRGWDRLCLTWAIHQLKALLPLLFHLQIYQAQTLVITAEWDQQTFEPPNWWFLKSSRYRPISRTGFFTTQDLLLGDQTTKALPIQAKYKTTTYVHTHFYMQICTHPSVQVSSHTLQPVSPLAFHKGLVHKRKKIHCKEVWTLSFSCCTSSTWRDQLIHSYTFMVQSSQDNCLKLCPSWVVLIAFVLPRGSGFHKLTTLQRAFSISPICPWGATGQHFHGVKWLHSSQH